MNSSELIRAFADREILPVDVNDVLACLRENGAQDDNIEFIGVDLDADILQGAIKAFHVRASVYGEPQKYVNIYYNRKADSDWQRMICCKELIHLLDPETARTTTQAEIDDLATRIGLPPEMQDPVSDGFATNIDRMAEYRAAAILLPMATRNLLMPKVKDGLLKVSDIAQMADMPTKYAGFIMNDVWDTVYPLLTR